MLEAAPIELPVGVMHGVDPCPGIPRKALWVVALKGVADGVGELVWFHREESRGRTC